MNKGKILRGKQELEGGHRNITYKILQFYRVGLNSYKQGFRAPRQ